MVWLDERNFLGRNRKLSPNWTGPYIILNTFPTGVVELQLQNRKLRINAGRIKPYVPPVSLHQRMRDPHTEFATANRHTAPTMRAHAPPTHRQLARAQQPPPLLHFTPSPITQPRVPAPTAHQPPALPAPAPTPQPMPPVSPPPIANPPPPVQIAKTKKLPPLQEAHAPTLADPAILTRARASTAARATAPFASHIIMSRHT